MPPDWLNYGFGPEELFFPQRQSTLGQKIAESIANHPLGQGGGTSTTQAGTSDATTSEKILGTILGTAPIVAPLIPKVIPKIFDGSTGGNPDLASTPTDNPTNWETTSDTTYPFDTPPAPTVFDPFTPEQGTFGDPAITDGYGTDLGWMLNRATYDPWAGEQLTTPDYDNFWNRMLPNDISTSFGPTSPEFGSPNEGMSFGVDAIEGAGGLPTDALTGLVGDASGVPSFGDPSNFFGTGGGPTLELSDAYQAFGNFGDLLGQGDVLGAMSELAPYAGFATIPFATAMNIWRDKSPWAVSGFGIKGDGSFERGQNAGNTEWGEGADDSVKVLNATRDTVIKDIQERAAKEGINLPPAQSVNFSFTTLGDGKPGLRMWRAETLGGGVDVGPWAWDGSFSDLKSGVDSLYGQLKQPFDRSRYSSAYDYGH